MARNRKRKKINLPKRKKEKPVKQKSSIKPLRREDMYDKEGKPIRKYEAYNGPVVTANTYELFKSPLERANAKRREEAHRKGQVMYKAKVWIPEHEGVKGHYIFVEKLVQAQVHKEVTKEVQNSNGGNNTADAPAEVSGVQGGSDSIDSGEEAGRENIGAGVSD